MEIIKEMTKEDLKREIARLALTKLSTKLDEAKGIPSENILLTGISEDLMTWGEGTHSKVPTDSDTHTNKGDNMLQFKVSHPVMVGNINILTASDEQLTHIIRAANQKIEADKDLAKLSAKFEKQRNELYKVIALCVEQLDEQ